MKVDGVIMRNSLRRIDLTGRICGDFKVLYALDSYKDTHDRTHYPWVCECQKCHSREIVEGQRIRSKKYKFCNVCISRTPSMAATKHNLMESMNELAELYGSSTRYTEQDVEDMMIFLKNVQKH